MSVLLLFFHAVEAMSLSVMAYVMYSFLLKWQSNPARVHKKSKPRKREDSPMSGWQTAEKKFRAKVYEE